MLTVAQVAILKGTSHQAVYDALRADKLPGAHKWPPNSGKGGLWLIPEIALAHWQPRRKLGVNPQGGLGVIE